MDANEELERRRQEAIAPRSGVVTRNPVEGGVTVAWLAAAFGLTEQAVRHKLRSCPVKTSKARGTTQQSVTYDLRVAAGYLVKPTFSVAEYMKALKRGDLPPQLQESTWAALLKQQTWEEKAGELWRTEKVREVLRGTFQNIKAQIQLWLPTIERNVEIPKPAREAITQLADALMSEIYEALVRQMQESQTGPQIAELAGMFGQNSTLQETMADEPAEDPDDFGGVI